MKRLATMVVLAALTASSAPVFAQTPEAPRPKKRRRVPVAQPAAPSPENAFPEPAGREMDRMLESPAPEKPVPAVEAPVEAEQGVVPQPGNDRQAIEAYLQVRLTNLQQSHKSQQEFGARLSTNWETFWTRVFKERKLFEVRIARQRLDLFESLTSIEPSAHASAMADFEKLQASVVRSFEDGQKQRLAEFFTQTMAELKAYSAEQEKARQAAAAEAAEAWRAQKKSGL